MGAFVHFEDEVCDLHNHQALAIAAAELCPAALADCAAEAAAGGAGAKLRLSLRAHAAQGLS